MNFDKVLGEEEFAEEGAGAGLDAEDCLRGLRAEVDDSVVETRVESDSDFLFVGFGCGLRGFGFFVAYFARFGG